eukprot:1156051-Pyramimonas_sp.AAC.1
MAGIDGDGRTRCRPEARHTAPETNIQFPHALMYPKEAYSVVPTRDVIKDLRSAQVLPAGLGVPLA